ncbi:aldehyde dehydrogenase family protein [Actinobaculum massiliense]|uniref:aldehyde dehydrogenase family protein n=1 Tax=Actinobaculum massiliense TaxID=202789 RepID=UPI00071AFAB2|nr:aldehyde dehydrogenase family protein [Actinobaculum massiliense]
MSTYAVKNPNTGETEEIFETLARQEIPNVIGKAWDAYESWRQTPLEERAKVLEAFGDLLEENADELAHISGREMGKPLKDGRAEIATVVAHARWFARHSAQHLAPTELDVSDGVKTYVRHDPIGVLLGIMPWNFPYSQIARFALPQLMVGNAILMKQAGICPVSSAKFAELLQRAGLPEGVYQNIYLDTEDTEEVLQDFRVKGFSLTGSEAAGASVAAIAGKHLKRSLLELGGNDPMMVLDSSDVAKVAREAVRVRTFNAGQVCTSNKRIIVMDDIYDEFVAAAKEAIAQVRVGAFDEDIDMGPLSSIEARDEVLARVERAVDDGATLHFGGKKLDRPGAYMSPALLTDVPEDQDIAVNELFGPVVVIYRAKDEDDALRLANSTEYGLQSSVWSEDLEKAEAFAARVVAGMTIVNLHRESGPEWPFGGVNRSGYGREEERWGLLAFTNEHAIRVHDPR